MKKWQTKEYRVWAAMIQRTQNPSAHNYARYGGRGIDVCARWLDSDNFLADMGRRPDGYSLDRIDNDGWYMPGNCRWASAKDQQNNTRRNHVIEFSGKSMTLQQWADNLGIKANTILIRIRRGWDVGRALGFED